MKGDALETRLAELLKPARLVVLDVDGTLTDGAVTITESGESLRFSVADGFGIKELQRAKIEVAWISGRASPAATARAKGLGVSEVRLGQLRKLDALREIQEKLGVEPRETVAMGDDLPDLTMRPRVALLAAPSNARAEVRERADLVTAARGGEGAVRELAEAILRVQGSWAAIVGAFGG